MEMFKTGFFGQRWQDVEARDKGSKSVKDARWTR
jgi:hypothetical protein